MISVVLLMQVPDDEETYIGRSTACHLATSTFMSAHRCDPEHKGSFMKITTLVLKHFNQMSV